MCSLHGAVAARRQATTELLFFASVGDIGRIKKICDTWAINVRSLPQPTHKPWLLSDISLHLSGL